MFIARQWLKNFDNFNPKPDLNQVQADAPQVQAEWQQCGQPPLLLLGEFFERDDVQQCLRETLPRAYYFIIPHPLRILKHPRIEARCVEWVAEIAEAVE
ncbi:Uncharacterised protein [Kingella kingae]|nr:Uncharacterised protein [Kingella kingae]